MFDRAHMLFLAGFLVFLVFMIVLDLAVFHRKAKVISARDAAGWSVFWVVLALLFDLLIYFQFGRDRALEYLTGYIIEKSLSVDNLFVFLMIFSFYRVPKEALHKVLFWGILGALVLRGLMIFVGASLVARFNWVLYIFGVFLLYAAAKMALGKMGEVDPSRSRLLVFLKKRFRFTDVYDGDRFFVKKDGVLWATPLMLVIVLVESSDVMFAVDSIPAIFAITTDAVVVFTSNMFAILGLRSLFFLLAGVMDKFVYLDKGLAVILGFVGLKILLASFVHIPIWASLSVVAVVLAITIAASLLRSEESAGRQGS